MSLEFKIEVFDPRKEQLQETVLKTSKITADPKEITKAEFELVKETRLGLMKSRTAINKAGKAAREDANTYVKKVIAYEKELIGIIEPEETRLKGIESAVKEDKIREVRLEKLPEMKERLYAINPSEDIKVTNEDLLQMDPNQFEVYYNEQVSLENERVRLALIEKEEKEAREKVEKEEKEEEVEKKKKQDAFEIEQYKRAEKLPERRKNLEAIGDNIPALSDDIMLTMDDNQYTTYYNDRVTAKNKADTEAIKDKKREDEEAEAKKIQDEKDEKERLAKEEKDEKERIEKEEAKKASDQKYQTWLKENGFDPKTHILTDSEGVISLYKFVGSYEKITGKAIK